MAAPHTNQRIGGTVTDAGGSTISGAVVKIEDEISGESLNNTVTRIIHV